MVAGGRPVDIIVAFGLVLLFAPGLLRPTVTRVSKVRSEMQVEDCLLVCLTPE
jgi:hypothetical protein